MLCPSVRSQSVKKIPLVDHLVLTLEPGTDSPNSSSTLPEKQKVRQGGKVESESPYLWIYPHRSIHAIAEAWFLNSGQHYPLAGRNPKGVRKNNPMSNLPRPGAQSGQNGLRLSPCACHSQYKINRHMKLLRQCCRIRLMLLMKLVVGCTLHAPGVHPERPRPKARVFPEKTLALAPCSTCEAYGDFRRRNRNHSL